MYHLKSLIFKFNVLLHGSGNQTVEMVYDDGLRSYKQQNRLKVCCRIFRAAIMKQIRNWVRDELEKFRAFSLVKVVRSA